MLRRLVDRFWEWERRRHDPAALVRCANPTCRREVRRGDMIGKFCSEDCVADYRETVQTY